MLCGLEIHQRLEGKKLFNRCPTAKPDTELDKDSVKIHRVLHSAKSELGKVDKATSFEISRSRKFEYLAPRQYCSLVDTDEEPPGPMDEMALISVLRFCNLVNAKIVDEIQVMRKTVVDGSNTSGFQRTALVATGGELESELGPIKLSTICIEEESSGILPSHDNYTCYRLDRLGIPLIEIATEPVFTSAESAAKGAAALGLALRSLPNVMRGLGTIRQDVNISIDGGARVEIKGLQDLKMLKTLVENEVKRQQKLIQIISELKKRGTKESDCNPIYLEVSDIFQNTESKILKNSLDKKGVILSAKLPRFAGLLGKELYSQKRFGSELSDYAKISGGVKGLIHSDEDMQKYKISDSELSLLKSKLKLNEDDAFILIADTKEKSSRAIISAIKRAYVFSIPKETRKADERGGSSFMRPLAGSSRMYPETDVPPVIVDAKLLEKSSEKLESIDAKKRKLEKLLNPEYAKIMLNSYRYNWFEQLVKKGYEPNKVANLLEPVYVSLRREHLAVSNLTLDNFDSVLLLEKNNKITKAAIPLILKETIKTNSSDSLKLAKDKNLLKISGEKLISLWKKEGTDMRSFMAKYRLIIDAKELIALIKKK